MSAGYADEANFAAIGEGFCTASLTVAQWTHGAHFAAALWLIRRRPDLLPERDMPAMIRRLNEAQGGVNSESAGYHETITQASLRGVRAHLGGDAPDAPLHAVHARLMAGPLGRSDWPLAHWSRERLFATEARARWVEPDIMPLPF
ncbi:hypothetical protein BH10PSE13_BH10PSE13_12100 [soil metagenome]